MRYDAKLVVDGEFSYESGYAATNALLDLEDRPTAIFAANDDMAAAVVSVAHRRGLDVPRDLSVVGFDDSSAATTVWPELTTVRQPTAEMGRLATLQLLERIRSPGAGRMITLDHAVLVRESTAAPRKRRR